MFNLPIYKYDWVTVAISKEELLRALFDMTLYNERFDSADWCLNDAKQLIAAGEMIKNALLENKTYV